MTLRCPHCGKEIKRRGIGLTAKQSRLLHFIDDFSSKNQGVLPSYDEMKDFMGFHSKSGVSRVLEQLESRGHIKRFKYRARSIKIISEGILQ